MKKFLTTIFIFLLPLSASASFFDSLKINELTLGDNSGVGQMQAWVASSSPVESITQRIFGKAVRLTGLTCSSLTNGGKLTLDANGVIICGNDVSGGGGGSGNVSTSTGETAGNLAYWTSTNGTPALLGKVATSSPSNGTGISLSGTGALVGSGGLTITNTAPDQTVAFTNGTGINVTGTYPNFTVTNTSPDQTVTLNNGTNINITGSYPTFTINSTAGGSSFGWPFDILTNYGVTNAATGTPIWAQVGINASSTSHFVYASTTALSATDLFSTNLTVSKIKPTTDSTTAIQMTKADGTNILNVDTTNGRVGIGTTSPTHQFQVTNSGSAYIDGGIYGATIGTLAGSGAGNLYLTPASGAISAYDGVTAFNFALYNGASRNIDLESSGNSYILGNVGIGTTSPSALLTVGSNNQFTVDASGNLVANAATIGSASFPPIIVTGNGGGTQGSPNGTYIYKGQYNGFNYYQRGSDSWYICHRSDGYWRITNSLCGVYSWYAGSMDSTPPLGVSWPGTSGATGNSVTAGGAASQLVVDSSGNMTTGGTLAVQGSGISYFSGNVGIGTTTPSEKLDVNGNLRIENQGQLKFSELRTNGNQSATISATSSMAADVNWTLPATDGTSGQVLMTNGVGNLFFGDIASSTLFSATTAWFTNLYIGAQTLAQYVLSLFSAGSHITLNNGQISVNEDFAGRTAIPLGHTFPQMATTSVPAGLNYIYTTPAGKKAVVKMIAAYNPTAGVVGYQYGIGDATTFNPITLPTATLAANGSNASGQTFVILEGQSLIASTSASGLNFNPRIIEFDNDPDLPFFATSTNITSANTLVDLYTSPANTYVQNQAVSFYLDDFSAYGMFCFNSNASSAQVAPYLSLADGRFMQLVATSSAISSRNSTSVTVAFNLSPGDKISVISTQTNVWCYLNLVKNQ